MNIRSIDTPPLSQVLPGTWRLLSRIDVAADGGLREEAHLGTTPIAMIMYDKAGHFAAQFMRRESRPEPAPPTSGDNNSRPMGGYDAYFGTYVVHDALGMVEQTLHAALSREHVGAVLRRTMRVNNDRLVIQLETTGADGAPLTRTLTWRRVG